MYNMKYDVEMPNHTYYSTRRKSNYYVIVPKMRTIFAQYNKNIASVLITIYSIDEMV